jgi:uncharacterized protein (DUF2384 family)
MDDLDIPRNPTREDVMRSAEETSRSNEKARYWLIMPNPQLEDQTPMALLDTETGRRLVQEILIQIDEGMFI